MKPFNLQEALAGKPVVDGYGSPVTELHYFATARGGQKLVAVVGGDADSFSDNGQFLEDRVSKNDLFMASEKKEGWVNIWRKSDGSVITGYHIYNSEGSAREVPEDYRTTRIAAIKISWEE